MDFTAILTWLAVVFNWCVENWQVALTLFPILGTVLTSILGKLGRGGVILLFLAAALKDHTLTDEEAATFVWMLAAVMLGFWFNASKWVLDYAPDHQIAMLKGKKFIPDTYRPEVQAVIPVPGA